jgi:ribonucleotide reductase alpha subunit
MDHNTETLAMNESATEAPATTETQAEAKTYTQQEVDNMMARMRGSIERKVLKPYQELGDPEELRALREADEKRRQEEQLKRGEFEKTLQELASKKDQEILKRDEIIKEYKVNSPLLNSAAKYKSVNPEQVQNLLARSVRLNSEGDVEVVDSAGSVRYNDSGAPIGVDDLVREFLDANPHFVQPTPTTSNTKSNQGTGVGSEAFDLASLDLTNPEHRKMYKQARIKGLI